MKSFWESWGNGRRRITRKHCAVQAAGNGTHTHIAVIEQVTGWQGDEPKFDTPEYHFLHGGPVHKTQMVGRTLCGLDATGHPATDNVCKRCERRAEEFQLDDAFGGAGFGIDDLLGQLVSGGIQGPLNVQVTLNR